LIFVAVGTAGLMIKGYCFVDEYLVGCVLLGGLLTILNLTGGEKLYKIGCCYGRKSSKSFHKLYNKHSFSETTLLL